MSTVLHPGPIKLDDVDCEQETRERSFVNFEKHTCCLCQCVRMLCIVICLQSKIPRDSSVNTSRLAVLILSSSFPSIVDVTQSVLTRPNSLFALFLF